MLKDQSENLEVRYIKTNAIMPNPNQPRKEFNNEQLIKLADSIRQFGVIQPLVVRKIRKKEEFEETPVNNQGLLEETFRNIGFESSNFSNISSEQSENSIDNMFVDEYSDIDKEYELIAGERRLRAALMIKLSVVPCIIYEMTEKTSAEVAIIENLIRENLNMFEEAEAYEKLMKLHKMTQEEIAKRLSVSQSAVANKIRLLKLSENERNLISKYNLTERHARALLRIDNERRRTEIINHIYSTKINVQSTEMYIDNEIESKKEKSKKQSIKCTIKDSKIVINTGKSRRRTYKSYRFKSHKQYQRV